MNATENELDLIKPWMFRVPYERFVLFATLLTLLSFSFFVLTLNVYIFLLLICGGIIYIQLQQAQYLGSAIRVHKKQFPEIFETFRSQARKLNISKASLYIHQDPYLQAYTLGITSCTIVLTSALVEQLDEKELAFVIGHELGHYKAGHTKFSTLFIPIGTSNLFSTLIFGFWKRMSEYSCDRCGLALTKDIEKSVSALIKLSIGKKLYEKIDIQGYVLQIRTAEKRSVKLSELLVDHPLVTNRIKKLIVFWKENFIVQTH